MSGGRKKTAGVQGSEGKAMQKCKREMGYREIGRALANCKEGGQYKCHCDRDHRRMAAPIEPASRRERGMGVWSREGREGTDRARAARRHAHTHRTYTHEHTLSLHTRTRTRTHTHAHARRLSYL